MDNDCLTTYLGTVTVVTVSFGNGFGETELF